MTGPDALDDATLARTERLAEDSAIGDWWRKRIRALIQEVRNLRRWKREASEVGMGLQDLGRALDLRLGTSITGPEAVAKAEALVAEVERLRAGSHRDWEAGHEYGLKQAAAVVHSEARWQWELHRRGTLGAQIVAQRMAMVEQILRDALRAPESPAGARTTSGSDQTSRGGSGAQTAAEGTTTTNGESA